MAESQCNGFIYTIQRGDTYFRLAQRFGVSVSAIETANPGVNPNALQIGQRICIPSGVETLPAPACNGFLYTIQPGDTLFRLSQRFGVSVSAIENANPRILPNSLRVAQRICIPTGGGGQPPPPSSCSGFLYTIQPGDTFGALASRFGVSVAAIEASNPGVNPNALQVGQRVCIPSRASIDCPGGQIYVVRSGDTLFTIARRFGISLELLESANPRLADPSRLTVGQSICVPNP